MRINLRNRPKGCTGCPYLAKDIDGNPIGCGSSEEHSSSEDCQRTREWFNSFEKELRESLEWLENKWHPRTAYNRGMKAGSIDRIKGALGE